MSKVIINTDGACIGNPGPGGFAAIIKVDGDLMTYVTGGEPKSTNNRMELSAVVEAMRAVNSVEQLQDAEITVRSDSQYVTNTFNKRWMESWQKKDWRNAKGEPVKNRELWEHLLSELEGHRHSWIWIKGHSGDPGNEECDALAMAQARQAESVGRYWCSAGNPLVMPEGVNPGPAAVSNPAITALEQALEHARAGDTVMARRYTLVALNELPQNGQADSLHHVLDRAAELAEVY